MVCTDTTGAQLLLGPRTVDSNVTLEEPASGNNTQPGVALEDVAQRLRKRGLVILISDMLAPVQQIGDGLRLLRGCLHDLVVFGQRD